MSSRDPRGKFAPTAIRMRALRKSSAHPIPADFAEFVGISVSNLSNVENGFPISRAVEARIIAKMPWVSGDWLQRGNESSLTVATIQRLAPLVAAESDTTTPRSRSRSSAR